jgi:S1-C subfamily serine protease
MIGEVLLDIDGKPVDNPESLSDALGRDRTTDQIHFHILRGGAIRELEVKVGNLEQTL